MGIHTICSEICLNLTYFIYNYIYRYVCVCNCVRNGISVEYQLSGCTISKSSQKLRLCEPNSGQLNPVGLVVGYDWDTGFSGI